MGSGRDIQPQGHVAAIACGKCLFSNPDVSLISPTHELYRVLSCGAGCESTAKHCREQGHVTCCSHHGKALFDTEHYSKLRWCCGSVVQAVEAQQGAAGNRDMSFVSATTARACLILT